MFTFVLIITALTGFVCPATYDVSINCIPLTQCTKLYELVMKKRNSAETIKLLRDSHCGLSPNGQPMVWCTEILPVQCKIPDNRIGACVDFDQCKSVKRVIVGENDLEDLQIYIQHPKCNAINQRYVCCPTENKPSFELVTPSTTNSNNLPNPDKMECGLQDIPKVFGGKITQFEEFPWTVQLQYQAGTKLTRNCGGTLISDKYVITAAHCVDTSAIRAVGNLVAVILGEHDIRNETDCLDMLGIKFCADPPVTVPVENIIVHPSWYNKPPATIDHDIALLRVASTVKFTQYVRPICLPSSKKTFKDGERLIVSGWGQTETEQSSPIKLKASIPVTNRDLCKSRYRKTKKLAIGDGEFCVGGEDGIDSCTGDSGGPLMYATQTNGETIWYLAGVVSFGSNQPCGAKNYPGLYTFLPNYIEWINKITKT